MIIIAVCFHSLTIIHRGVAIACSYTTLFTIVGLGFVPLTTLLVTLFFEKS